MQLQHFSKCFRLCHFRHLGDVYRRQKSEEEIEEIVMYLWIDGWWIGKVVGGEQVWYKHSDADSLTPPERGWLRYGRTWRQEQEEEQYQ